MAGLLGFENSISAIARLGQSAAVSIGTVALTGMEVPDSVTIGGQQRLIIHQLPGGDRIVDAAGNDPQRIEFSGRFIGLTALGRAQALEAIRNQAKPIVFSVAGMEWTVLISDYAYTYTSKGAVIPYRITLERLTQPVSKSAKTTRDITALVGKDVGDALTTITGKIGEVSQTALNFAGQFQTVVGQVTPVANLIGLSGPFAKAQNALQSAQGILQGGVDLASLPGGVTALQGYLEDAGTGLKTAINQIGENLSSISLGPAANNIALSQNMGLQIAATSALNLTSRASKNATVASGEPSGSFVSRIWGGITGLFGPAAPQKQTA